MQTLLTGAKVYRNGSFSQTDILIRDGIISSFGSFGSGSAPVSSETEVIDFTDRYIFPGFIDVHVHLREPGFSYKERISTGTEAAARGGYTDICPMPNLNPVPDSAQNLQKELDIIEKEAIINVHPYGSLTVNEDGRELAALKEMARQTVAFSDDGRGVADGELMREAMKICRGLGKIVAAHCEDKAVIGGADVHAGKAAELLGTEGISSESEWQMIERDIGLAKETGAAYHVCHVSTKESVALIRRAKAEGVDITCETAPHYLLLSEDDIADELNRIIRKERAEREAAGAGISRTQGKTDALSTVRAEDYRRAAGLLGRYKMNPPLRTEEDRQALIAGLLDGTIDMIATDHAPHSAEEKARGLLEGPMGITGLECAFPVLYTGLVRTGMMSLETLIEKLSISPAARFGLRKGSCGPEAGYPANLTVFALDEEYMIEPENFASMGRSTPFEGRRVYGRCLATICSGRFVYRADAGDRT